MSQPEPPAAKKSRPLTPLRIAGIGCAGVAAFALVFVAVAALMVKGEMSKPMNRTAEITELAGLPVYPGAQFDEDLTRTRRALLAVSRGLYPGDSATTVGFRTDDDPETRVIPFYDDKLSKLGFTKTRLGGGSKAGASYAGDTTTITVQIEDDPGEERQLILTRFDAGAKKMLDRRTDIVTPEDFQTKTVPGKPSPPAKAPVPTKASPATAQ